MSKGKLAGIIVGCVAVVTVVMVLVVPGLLTTYTLSVSVNPSGAGSVYPSGGEYEPGTQIALVAIPESGYTFSHWSGGASGATCNISITMDSDKDITAYFETEESPPADTYTLTTDVSPSGAGSVSPAGGEYEAGAEVTLTASAASGYSFDHWGGGASGNTSDITVTMDSDRSVTANFRIVTYALTTNIDPSGAGSVSPSSGEYYHGVQVTLIASPASGYAFDHWGGDASGNTSKITVTMDSDKDITAYFLAGASPPSGVYRLTTHISPSGAGSVSPSSGEYGAGVKVTLTASAAGGYTFDHWGGGASGTTSTITVTMNSDKDITAYFETGVSPPGTYTLTTYISPSGAGSVSPSSGEYGAGVKVTLTANAASGYTFDHWSGSASGTTSTITITMNSNKSLTAYFKTTGSAVLFSDDFSSDNHVWDTFSNGDGSVSYENGWLHIVNTTWAELPTITRAHRYFTDFILEVETKLVDGAIDNWHSVGCRYQDDGNYYEFSISADGYYCIAKWVDGDWTYLLEAAQSSYINTGTNAVNLMHIECIGSSLSLSVNRHLLGQVTDTTYSGGDIALAASGLTGPPEYTEIAFDNIWVSSE
jgi:uncharacterized repeat protein (TIGR02543 family)